MLPKWAIFCVYLPNIREENRERVYQDYDFSCSSVESIRTGAVSGLRSIRTCEARRGAVSLMSKASAVPLASLKSRKAPPPMPLDAGLTTPRHSAAATAASTAFPPSRRRSLPILEHRPSSAATAPCLDVRTSLLAPTGLPWQSCSNRNRNNTAMELHRVINAST